jgi:hypothetical protein
MQCSSGGRVQQWRQWRQRAAVVKVAAGRTCAGSRVSSHAQCAVRAASAHLVQGQLSGRNLAHPGVGELAAAVGVRVRHPVVPVGLQLKGRARSERVGAPRLAVSGPSWWSPPPAEGAVAVVECEQVLCAAALAKAWSLVVTLAKAPSSSPSADLPENAWSLVVTHCIRTTITSGPAADLPAPRDQMPSPADCSARQAGGRRKAEGRQVDRGCETGGVRQGG